MKEVGPSLIGTIIGNIPETAEDRPNALTSHRIFSSWSIFKYMYMCSVCSMVSIVSVEKNTQNMGNIHP